MTNKELQLKIKGLEQLNERINTEIVNLNAKNKELIQKNNENIETFQKAMDEKDGKLSELYKENMKILLKLNTIQNITRL